MVRVVVCRVVIPLAIALVGLLVLGTSPGIGWALIGLGWWVATVGVPPSRQRRQRRPRRVA